MILETLRLRLRPFAEEYILPFMHYRSDPQVARYQGWEAPFSLEQAEEFVHDMQARTPGQPGCWYQLAIELKSSGELAGDCAFKRLTEDPRQAEIGFTLAAAFQGQGYATEAVGCLLNYLFGELVLHRVRADCDPENRPSARLLERLGFRHEGRLIDSLWFKGRWASEDLYALLRREWVSQLDQGSQLPGPQGLKDRQG